jgi:hypothetical protein
VAMERPGTVATKAPPEIAIPACAAMLFASLVRYGTAVLPATRFCKLKVVETPFRPVFSTTITTLPSVLMKADGLRLPGGEIAEEQIEEILLLRGRKPRASVQHGRDAKGTRGAESIDGLVAGCAVDGYRSSCSSCWALRKEALEPNHGEKRQPRAGTETIETCGHQESCWACHWRAPRARFAPPGATRRFGLRASRSAPSFETIVPV